MKKIISLLLLFPALLAGLAACDEETGEVDEYVNWKARNEQAFAEKLAEAKAAIAEAQSLYGDQWEDHCDWRLARTYTLPADAPAGSGDTVVVRITERGAGSGCPLYTDSVKVNFLLRLLPTEEHPEGEIVSHSGYSSLPEEIFSDDFATPSKLLVSNTVEGFTTILMRMHIGDRWRVFIPWQLGYGSTAVQTIPAYSMLDYDMQLKAFSRKGSALDD